MLLIPASRKAGRTGLLSIAQRSDRPGCVLVASELPWHGLIPAQWAGGAGEGTKEVGASAEG